MSADQDLHIHIHKTPEVTCEGDGEAELHVPILSDGGAVIGYRVVRRNGEQVFEVVQGTYRGLIWSKL